MIDKIALSSNDDKRTRSFNKTKSHAYGAGIKTIHFDDVTGEKKTKYKPNWPYIPDHPYRILRTESGKTNALLNLTRHQ